MIKPAASPCCHPNLTLDQALRLYSELGFRQFEAFTSWASSALDWHGDAQACRAMAAEHDLLFASPADDSA